MAGLIMDRRRFVVLGLAAVAITVAAIVLSRPKAEPIKIALVTTLTGPASTAGVFTRNGALFAIEETNAQGGINGRQVVALVRDDKADPAEALRIDRALIKEGVVAFLGHYLSSISVQVAPLMNEHQMPILSLGAATGVLYGLDDQFIRITLPNNMRTPIAARESYNRQGVRKVAIVYDRSNAAYTESVKTLFYSTFKQLGGEVALSLPFNSKEAFSASDLATELLQSGADGLFLVTDAMHGALICQHVRRQNAEIPISACAWACCVPDFILDGGRAVDGVISIVECDMNLQTPMYLAFKKAYQLRFGQEPSLHARDAYMMTKMLIKALEQTTDPSKIKAALLSSGGIEGFDGHIGLDAFGEPLRPAYVMQVQDGQGVILSKIEPSLKERNASQH